MVHLHPLTIFSVLKPMDAVDGKNIRAKDKRIFLVENYPKNIDKLPGNLQEVQHRARDIMFSDKTVHNVQLSKSIT